jgi:hypothetical protein
MTAYLTECIVGLLVNTDRILTHPAKVKLPPPLNYSIAAGNGGPFCLVG